jgi:L-fucose mutarotase
VLRTGLIHPQILEALGSAGHGSLVLISDGNYPHLTAPNPNARRVYLNLRRGVVSVEEILSSLLPAMPVERVAVMDSGSGEMPEIQKHLLSKFGPETEVAHLSRFDFYEATRSPDLALVIASGDEHWWANLLLTIGAIPDTDPVE